jgi:hypothetical protein
MTLQEIANAFNRNTNLSDDFIISQFFIGELQNLITKHGDLKGFPESCTKRAQELYARHFS